MKKVIVQCSVIRDIEMEITEEEERRLLNWDLPWRITETVCEKIKEKGDCFSEFFAVDDKETHEPLFEV